MTTRKTMQTFRPLRSDEVECRIGTVSKQGKGLSLLLYKDARCDARILDETLGPENWQCEFYECKGTLFCKVGVLVDRGEQFAEWVWKDDAGSPSDMEAKKGEASDAFKRACFKWGIGRELYTSPFIWVNASDCNLVDRNGKWQCYDTFSVTGMEVSDGRIVALEVTNDKTKKVVFTLAKPEPKPSKQEAIELAEITRQVGDKRAVWTAFKANGIEGARALVVASPTQVELFDQDQQF